MAKAVYVGLSGPTYYDYRNLAHRAANDTSRSPNPVLENAFGLAVFYEEIWFLCESLCPQSLRGHPRIRYVDREFSHPLDAWVQDDIRMALNNVEAVAEADYAVIRKNFDDYHDLMRRAGVHWVQEGGGGLDNHSLGLDILNARVSANSNKFESLQKDLMIIEVLRKKKDFDLSLNSFGQHLHRSLCPAEYHPHLQSSAATQLGSLIINAKVTNSLGIAGPDDEVFDKICTSGFVRDFRGYVSAKSLEDAGRAYEEVVQEIEGAIAAQVRKAARDARPVKGLVNMAVGAAVDWSGYGPAKSLFKWYADAVNPSPLGAAAFLYDLK